MAPIKKHKRRKYCVVIVNFQNIRWILKSDYDML